MDLSTGQPRLGIQIKYLLNVALLNGHPIIKRLPAAVNLTMSTRMPSFHISNSDDLDRILNVCRRELEDNMSVTSISSTSTASDLPGPGRTLGRLYSFLGVRLETQLGRLAERFGYSPNAIEQRVLARASHLPPQGSNGQNKLKKDLKRLIGYTQLVLFSFPFSRSNFILTA